jgi:hypothetical protein
MKRGELLDERAEEEALLDAERKGVDVTANRKAFRVLVRNATFRLVRALAQREERFFLDMVQTEPGQPPLRVEELVALMDPYWAEYDELRIDAEARGPQHFQLEENSGNRWLVNQSLLDPEEHLEWRLRLAVDLPASRDEGGVVLRWVGIDRPEVPATAQ